ncbi:MAG: hypothetical protein JXA10_06095, partial [Anaerolineae bacterium]|nr:hypothetical protein [Anaerolineae bacterium]
DTIRNEDQTMAERKYHPDYRQADVSAIVRALDQGLSVSVIGPPSIGKSNLLQFLDQARLSGTEDSTNPWIRYATNTMFKGNLIMISVDPNALLPSLPRERGDVAAAAWPGFELLTHRTTITAELYPLMNQVQVDQGDDSNIATQIANLQTRFESAHPSMTDFRDHLHAHLALRHLESIIDASLKAAEVQQNPIRIIYFMDEFERFLVTMPNYFFVALRSLRDRFKERVMFVTFTRNSLPYIIGEGERMLILEPFIELFYDSTVYLKPFNDDDAWRMIDQLEEARTVSKDDHGLGLLIRASGGFAGLLRGGFKHADKLSQIQHQDYGQAIGLAAKQLVAEKNIQEECKTLLRGLRSDEINTIFGIASQRTNLDQRTIDELLNKSLLSQATAGGVIRVSPPVLAAYIRNNPTPPESIPMPRPATMPE